MYTSVQAIKEYLNTAEQLGVDVHAVMAELGLSAGSLSDGQGTINADILIKMLKRLIPLSGDPLFGLTQSTQIQANSFQILGYLALNSSNTKETMELVVQYEQAWGTTGRTFIEDHGSDVFVGWRCFVDDPLVSRHMVENVLASWRLYSKSFVNLDEAPQQVWFAHQGPDDLLSLDKYQQIFNSPVRFNQAKSGIWVTREQWLRPLPQANQSMLAVLEEHAAAHVKKVASRQVQGGPNSDKVIRLLRLMLGHTVPQKRQIARQLGVSERTLQRLLNAEGTQYQKLLADVRLEIAMEYLKNSAHDTGFIAQQAGFSEVRSFYRFIKQSTGKTATDIRNQRF